MAITERITVIVDEKGASTVASKFSKIGDAAFRLNAILNVMSRLWDRASGAVKTFTGTLDVFTNMQNRLSLVTHGSANLTRVTRDLARVATETRQEFAHTADVYSRVALSVQHLGRTQDQTLKFVENLNKAIVLSGASAVEANAGMIQLAQGIASNRLSGDELRSVLEQLPKVADLIAKHLGVTRGALRELGQAGKLEAEAVFDAIRLGDKEVKAFDQTTATFSQTIIQMKNQLTLWLGEMDKSIGLTKSLTKFMRDLFHAVASFVREIVRAASESQLLRDVFKGLGVVMEWLGDIFGSSAKQFVFVLKVVIEMIDRFYELAKAITNVSFLQDIVGGLDDKAKKARPQVDELTQAINRLREAGAVVDNQKHDPLAFTPGVAAKALSAVPAEDMDKREDQLLAIYRKRVRLDGELAKAARKRAEEITKVSNKQQEELRLAQATNDIDRAKIQITREYLDALGTESLLLSDVNYQTLVGLHQGAEELALAKKRAEAAKKYKSEKDAARDALRSLLGSLDSVTAAENRLEDGIKAAAEARKFGWITDKQEEEIKKKLKESLVDELFLRSRVLDNLNRERDALFLSNREKERQVKIEEALTQIQGSRHQQDEALRAQIEDMVIANMNLAEVLDLVARAKQGVLDIVQKETERQTDGQEAFMRSLQAMEDQRQVQELVNRGKIAEAFILEKTLALERQRINMKPEMLALLEKQAAALQRAHDEAQKYNTILAQFAKTFVNEFVKAITDSIVELEFKFDNFVKNLLRMLTEMIVKYLLFQAITGMGGGSFAKFAFGGVPAGFAATGGSFQVTGAGGPDSQVALIRTSPGETIDVRTEGQQRAMESGGGGGGPAPQVNVVMDPRMIADSFHTAAFRDAVVEHIHRNPSAFRRAMRTRR